MYIRKKITRDILLFAIWITFAALLKNIVSICIKNRPMPRIQKNKKGNCIVPRVTKKTDASQRYSNRL